MARVDPGARFEKMSEEAKAAGERLELAGDAKRDQLYADAAIAEDKAAEAAKAVKDRIVDNLRRPGDSSDER
jgi:hypothetical protein